MKLEVERYRIIIIPESETDEAYLEEVLGLKRKGDAILAKRINAVNMSCWAYLEIKKMDGNVKMVKSTPDKESE